MFDLALTMALLGIGWGAVIVLARRWKSRWRWVIAPVALAVVTLTVALALHVLSNSRRLQLAGEMVTRIETDRPVVALTFDDGPSRRHTASVLSTLESRGVIATFFLTGRESAENPDEVRAIARGGHEIGNHSWSHSRMLFRSSHFIRTEIEMTDDAIRDSGYRGPIHFRSPYGKRLLDLPLYLRRTGRKNILWDLEPESDRALVRNPQAMADYVIANAQPGSIILLHVMYDSRESSRQALPLLIDGLRSRGLEFATVSQLIEIDRRRE
jgi:peptidoglycan-N-acetylglucosamine deacetylase